MSNTNDKKTGAPRSLDGAGSVSKTLSEHLMDSEFLRGLVSIRSVDAYLESLHVIIKRFEDARSETEKQNSKNKGLDAPRKD